MRLWTSKNVTDRSENLIIDEYVPISLHNSEHEMRKAIIVALAVASTMTADVSFACAGYNCTRFFSNHPKVLRQRTLRRSAERSAVLQMLKKQAKVKGAPRTALPHYQPVRS